MDTNENASDWRNQHLGSSVVSEFIRAYTHGKAAEMALNEPLPESCGQRQRRYHVTNALQQQPALKRQFTVGHFACLRRFL